MTYPLTGSYYFIYRPSHYNKDELRAELFNGANRVESVAVGEMSTSEVTEYFEKIIKNKEK